MATTGVGIVAPALKFVPTPLITPVKNDVCIIPAIAFITSSISPPAIPIGVTGAKTTGAITLTPFIDNGGVGGGVEKVTSVVT